MEDDELRRLKRIIIVSWTLIVIFTIGIVTWASWEVKDIRNQVANLPRLTPTVINGRDGKDGLTPVKGVDYFDGQNGLNGTNGKDSTSTTTVVEQPTYINVPVPGPQGADGSQGPPGASGKAVFIQQLPDGTLQCHYSGDTFWQPITECQ